MNAHVKHTAEGVLVHVAGGLQPMNLHSVHHRPQRGVILHDMWPYEEYIEWMTYDEDE